MVQKVSFLCCQFCPYKTRFTGNLAKHIRTHTGERPFECQFCGKRFASKSNYNTHVVIHSPVGSLPLKFPFGGKVGKIRQSSSRPNMSNVNSEIVRSVPMVKTLLSSNRSSSRSAVQKLSPIGSFLMPNLTNSSFSHTALYSSFNLSGYEASLSSRTDCFVDGSASSSFDNDPVDPSNSERRNAEDQVPTPEAIEVNDRDCEDDRSSIEDVKPTIFDILSILPCEDKAALTKQIHNSQLIASIKQEAVDGVLRAENSYFARPGLGRRVRPGLRYSEGRPVRGTDDSVNGHRSGRDSNSLARLDNDDPSRIHTELLVDTLVKESRLFRCDSCNILFPEYSMYVLHLGCHGNEGAYQCHFCRQFFEDRFGFATHFVRCPHEPSDCC